MLEEMARRVPRPNSPKMQPTRRLPASYKGIKNAGVWASRLNEALQELARNLAGRQIEGIEGPA
jgi:hypothetical protein